MQGMSASDSGGTGLFRPLAAYFEKRTKLRGYARPGARTSSVTTITATPPRRPA